MHAFNQKIISKNQKFATMLMAVALFAFPLLVFIPKVEAGSPALQAILDKVNKTCKDMNRGSGTWDDCEDYQGQLAVTANCSDKLFFEENGKWNTKPKASDECQTKINDGETVAKRLQVYLDQIKKDCTEVDGIQFKVCQASEAILVTVGCSKTMFEDVDGGHSYQTADFNACQNIVNKIKTDPATKPGEGQAPDAKGDGKEVKDVDCQGGFGLSWIICPIFELGANMTNDVFNKIIAPLMESVPVSTEGSFYDAWKGFRLIGNILLIGFLLMIVYGQTRGDR